jgi:hypothetical protein
MPFVAKRAKAWTEAPATLEQLYRQRRLAPQPAQVDPDGVGDSTRVRVASARWRSSVVGLMRWDCAIVRLATRVVQVGPVLRSSGRAPRSTRGRWVR